MFDYWQKMESGQVFHIYNRSISNVDLYYTDENFAYFLRKWHQYLGNYLDVYAYCLIPNHFHFLAKVKPITSIVEQAIRQEKTRAANKLLTNEILYSAFIEDQFKRLFSGHAQALNKQLERRGALFQKRFKRVRIQSKEKFIDKLLYIHHNPIHHGLFDDYQAWRFSSYNAYFSDTPSKIRKDVVFKLFDKDITKAKKQLFQLHQNYKAERFRKLLEDDDIGE